MALGSWIQIQAIPILALNDLIKGRIEDQNRKNREHLQRLEMRRFYDTQVDEKR